MEVPDSALVDRAVLVVWHGVSTPEVMQSLVEELRARVGVNGTVSLENADRLEACKWHRSCSYLSRSLRLSPSSLHTSLLYTLHQSLMKSPRWM